MSGEQTIRRGVRNARYAAIPNHVFEDDRLSMEARWLLGYLLSKPDNWTVVIGDIVKRGNCGRDKARKMIAELVEYGYADREQTRADGRFGASVLVIYDEPVTRISELNQDAAPSVANLPQTDLPATVFPSPVLPSPVKSAHSNNLQIENTDSYQERDARKRDFDGPREDDRELALKHLKRWYPTWPAYLDSKDHLVEKYWLALSLEERQQAAEKAVAFCEARKAIGRTHPLAAESYLSRKLWLKVDENEAAKPKRPTIPASGRIAVPVFGPAYAAARMLPLLDGAVDFDLPSDLRERVRSTYEVHCRRGPHAGVFYRERLGLGLADDGRLIFPDDFERQEYRRRVVSEGFPEVNRLHEAAKDRSQVTVDAVFERMKDLCEFVPMGCETWAAWEREHEARGWLMLPAPSGMKGAYFPKGGPEGLEEFERAARSIMTARGEDDAA